MSSPTDEHPSYFTKLSSLFSFKTHIPISQVSKWCYSVALFESGSKQDPLYTAFDCFIPQIF